MVREVSAAAAAGGGGGGVDEAGLLVLSAGQVKRGLRFCMKVHRFREMCRGGSCVTVWKVGGVLEIAHGVYTSEVTYHYEAT